MVKKIFILVFIVFISVYNFSVFGYSFNISDYNYSKYLIDLHFSLSEDGDISSIDIKDVSFIKSMNLIQQMQYYANYDITADLDYGLSKKYHINNYLLLVSKLLFQADIELSYIDNILDIAQDDYNYCLESKKLSDSYFFQGFDMYNVSLMEESYNNSLNNDVCMSKNKVKINAWKIIHKKLSFFYLILEKRHENLSFNKDRLIQDYSFSQIK